MEIEVILPADFLVSARKKALEMFSASLDVQGFRKGHVPENITVEKIGESKILEEAVDLLLKEHFSKIIGQEKLDIIGRPKISITKSALGNPVEFKAVFAVLPPFELPEYRIIAKSASATSLAGGQEATADKAEASEKEVSDVLLQIRKNKAHFDWHKSHPEEKGHDHFEIKDEDLPKLDDELAKAAGNFKNLDELKEKVRQNIIEEKKVRNIEKRRAAIMEELLKNTEIDLPQILIDSEIEKSLAQMKNDVERAGIKWDDYLSNVKKTEEDLRKDLRDSSGKKLKYNLFSTR